RNNPTAVTFPLGFDPRSAESLQSDHLKVCLVTKEKRRSA
ncbi:MAG: hypothetical protein ACI9SY_000756, partial [Candidatus Paceibacteria bacterium]